MVIICAAVIHPQRLKLALDMVQHVSKSETFPQRSNKSVRCLLRVQSKEKK